MLEDKQNMKATLLPQNASAKSSKKAGYKSALETRLNTLKTW